MMNENLSQEQELDQILEDLNPDKNDVNPVSGKTAADFEKELQKAIDRRIRKVALKTVLVVLLVLAVIFAGISPVMDLIYPNAVKLTQAEYVTDESGSYSSASPLEKAMNAYYSTMRPYVFVETLSASREGFGKYSISLSYVDETDQNMLGVSNCELEMVRGELQFRNGETNPFMAYLGLFPEDYYGEDYYEGDYSFEEYKKDSEEEQKELISDIKALPDSSLLYVGIRADEAVDADVLLSSDSFADHDDASAEDLTLDWVRIDQPECDLNFGVGISKYLAYSEADMEDLHSAEDIRAAYLENLQTLLEYSEYLDSFSLYMDNEAMSFNTSVIQDCIKNLQSSDKVNVKCYYISGGKDQILSYLETLNGTANVLKVQYSGFN